MSLFLSSVVRFDPMILVIVLVVVGLLAVMMLPMFANRKRGRAVLEMRDCIGKGDVVKTVSGVIGTVVDVEAISPVDKVVIIETGCEGCRGYMRMDIAGIWGVIRKAGAAPHPSEVCCDPNKPASAPQIEPYGETQVIAPTSEQALDAGAPSMNIDPFAEDAAEAVQPATAEEVIAAESGAAAKPAAKRPAAKKTTAGGKK